LFTLLIYSKISGKKGKRNHGNCGQNRKLDS
jgi:hypothetical protein